MRKHITLILILFSVSAFADAPKYKKVYKSHPILQQTIERFRNEPAISPGINTSHRLSKTGNSMALRVTNNAVHAKIDSSWNGYGWLNHQMRSVDRISTEYGDFVIVGFRHYNLGNNNTGIIGLRQVDVSDGLNDNPDNMFLATDLNAELTNTLGGRYPGVVALDLPFIHFNQYISGDADTQPAVSHPYIISDYDGYGLEGGDFTASIQMDLGYSHYTFPENRLWNGPVAMVKDDQDVYHYAGIFSNWILDGESQPADYVILNASAEDPTDEDDWVIDTDPALLDTMDFFIYPGIAMNSNGFGAIVGIGHDGPHPEDTYYLSDVMPMIKVTQDYGVTWSEPKALHWEDMGIPEAITPEDSISIPVTPGDTTEYFLYDSLAYIATNHHTDVLVSEDNKIYIAFNLIWGPWASSTSYYWYPDYSGVFVAVSDDAGVSFQATQVAANNGFYVDDEDAGDVGVDDNYYHYSEVDLALDELGIVYAAWLDRPNVDIRAAEIPRYRVEDPIELKMDIYTARSTDGGQSWSWRFNVTESPDIDEYELNMAKNAGSKNGGTIWLAYNEVDPFSETTATDEIYTDKVNRLWVAEASGFPQDTTAIGGAEQTVPGDITLKQNYPNPFNPVTSITYSLVNSGYIELSVFDISGKKVETLVSGTQRAGKHIARWDAGSHASGIYFYKLTAKADGRRTISRTRKMMVIK